ncbi:CRISPR-associated endonuclease Cas2 [Levilactobacillus brevis]|uniref:CRISPR-associated endoribonuclease Cas2 n=1 Tax=Levilactobacillus hammesii TaxID=267633 RepID=A0A921F1N0_9LACO|nr:CRISPR-associated endonuclease Cas2 [Levilactobacillus brevis]HJE86450.1 CRISPR-associated endonuclease Cas2 [Levilactobacillus hammesii]
MRLMIMFDLPMVSSEDRRNYRRFRKILISEGFFMMQFSVYVRVCANSKNAKAVEQRIAAITPEKGLVQSVMLTEKQYQAMHFIAGEPNHDIINSAERTIMI